ncbi:type III secretion protein N (ATPase) [Natronocella acetinitrilica]|uniref:protein-secreting ATPase n=1 Tax=Natronocella acetinitrilica TaxID=414046 RepID=A0AAE3G4M6_9GAMM|nr:type III secretion protein N (ATPase) [Natronocella acetinitrilica]
MNAGNLYQPVLDSVRQRLAEHDPVTRYGRLLEVTGNALHARVPRVGIGEICELRPRHGRQALIQAEVIGFGRDRAILSPLDPIDGLSPDTEVLPLRRTHQVAMGDELLGQVLDGLGRPLDGSRSSQPGTLRSVMADPPDPLQRPPIDTVFSTGVRAIDGFTTLGVGQRVGVFAAAGVGKSSLLGMLARNAEVDVNVVALIGERGREVRDFVERSLPPAVRQRTVLVVATSDRPALQRVRAAHVATAIAEYFRDQGRHVMLLMDSVTRFARALREIGLAAGEPPTRRGFPASVFAELPRLVERTGVTGEGAITALYTVLVEGDDMTEPVADEVRSLIDGHLVLSRELASANHYPAIDILESRSRLMESVADQTHLDDAGRLRRLLARHKEVELLLRMGEYRKGADEDVDQAVAIHEPLTRLLRQDSAEKVGLAHTVASLRALLDHG